VALVLPGVAPLGLLAAPGDPPLERDITMKAPGAEEAATDGKRGEYRRVIGLQDDPAGEEEKQQRRGNVGNPDWHEGEFFVD
jgi:hypothetical protein